MRGSFEHLYAKSNISVHKSHIGKESMLNVKGEPENVDTSDPSGLPRSPRTQELAICLEDNIIGLKTGNIFFILGVNVGKDGVSALEKVPTVSLTDGPSRQNYIEREGEKHTGGISFGMSTVF